ncbi:MAG: HAD-IIIA family hydrolase [Deltaproteobacteria bacterium]|jgi:D-glycero-D-manno-heptose 1,7-bisphosphate phosphatase|nr:HAD-IIIA family hydrolase [Deltaproteobacteria bacterium]
MPQSFPRPAVFLDRDGTLNHDIGYLSVYEDWKWLPKVLDALRLFNSLELPIVVITNQSGIARGFFTKATVDLLHTQVLQQLEHDGIHLESFYYCPHHPDFTGPCLCRKPLPGLILKAKEELNLDLSKSFLVGNQATDILAGINSGILHNFLIADASHEPDNLFAGENIILKAHPELSGSPQKPYTFVEDLFQAAHLIQNVLKSF